MKLTPKEKAKELVDKFMKVERHYDFDYSTNINFKEAKQCALIDVNNTITALEEMFSSFGIGEREMTNIPFYEEVKKEIEKLNN